MVSAGQSRPWKKSFRSTPRSLKKKISEINSNLIVIGAVKKITLESVAQYSHLGLNISDGATLDWTTVVPAPETGSYSKRNATGWEAVRKDLPKLKKTYTWETPNFGDAVRYGTHIHNSTREVYQREVFEPPNLGIAWKVLKSSPSGHDWIVSFRITEPLDKRWDTFESRLLFHINFMQENVGASDAFASDTSEDEMATRVKLDWEIFPAGKAQQFLAAIGKKVNLSPKEHGVVSARVKMFDALEPKALLQGTGSFDSYIGALFDDDLVVFENLRLGNALYVLYEDWQQISRLPRSDLLRGTNTNFDRFVHTLGWETRFKQHIKDELERRAKA